MSDDNLIKRRAAKRKAAIVMETIKGDTIVAEVAPPKGIRDQYGSELREIQEAQSEAHL